MLETKIKDAIYLWNKGEKTENFRGFSSLNADYWVLKLDENRNIEWQRTIGGEDEDLFKTVCQTNDGGS